jgi:hypothetical protein
LAIAAEGKGKEKGGVDLGGMQKRRKKEEEDDG